MLKKITSLHSWNFLYCHNDPASRALAHARARKPTGQAVIVVQIISAIRNVNKKTEIVRLIFSSVEIQAFNWRRMSMIQSTKPWIFQRVLPNLKFKSPNRNILMLIQGLNFENWKLLYLCYVLFAELLVFHFVFFFLVFLVFFAELHLFQFVFFFLFLHPYQHVDSNY